MGWQTIDSAPRDGTPFLALNHDCEVWVARADREDPQRWVFRKNELLEPRAFRVHHIGGKELLEQYDDGRREEWRSVWCYWTRGYKFSPTHWLVLPAPPQ